MSNATSGSSINGGISPLTIYDNITDYKKLSILSICALAIYTVIDRTSLYTCEGETTLTAQRPHWVFFETVARQNKQPIMSYEKCFNSDFPFVHRQVRMVPGIGI